MIEKKTHKMPSWAIRIGIPIAYVVWVVGVFISVQIIIALLLLGLAKLGISTESVSRVVLVTLLSVLTFGLTLLVVVWIPRRVLNQTTGREVAGVARLPSWMDVALGPISFVPYALLSGVLVMLVLAISPSVDIAQQQQLGFSTHIFGFELAIAFLLLVVIAPLVEEILFRGYLYGKLRQRVGLLLSVLLVSLCFGALHGQLNVGIDTFALSVMLCLLREFTGSVWAGVLLHATKNGLAFYILFINPSLLSTIGG